MTNYAPSRQAKRQAAAELELRQRKRAQELFEHEKEIARCEKSCEYFLRNFVFIYDATLSMWLRFDLWDAQVRLLEELADNRKVVILKARQLGISYLVLGYCLHLMLFKPAATVCLFSKGDDEAVELLDFRLKGMHDRLPTWLQADSYTNNKHELLLANGSRATAFATTGGRSYTATLAIVDEADFVLDLATLMNAVEPIVDAGGQLVVLSTPDKAKPMSLFKNIFRAASARANEYKEIFLSWRARPSRTQEWYDQKKQASLADTGALDKVHQEYPETALQALAPRSLDKAIPAAWVEMCYVKALPIVPPGMPEVTGLTVYQVPKVGMRYVIGADPAEGNPTSDDSSLHVLELDSGEEAARFVGKFTPNVFGGRILNLSDWYNKAGILPERNNHGHAVILYLQNNGAGGRIIMGTDHKPGWNSNGPGKIRLYDEATEAFRTRNTTLHSTRTYDQLVSIESGSLRAPANMPDDEADSYALSLLARVLGQPNTTQTNYMTEPKKLEKENDEYWER